MRAIHSSENWSFEIWQTGRGGCHEGMRLTGHQFLSQYRAVIRNLSLNRRVKSLGPDGNAGQRPSGGHCPRPSIPARAKLQHQWQPTAAGPHSGGDGHGYMRGLVLPVKIRASPGKNDLARWNRLKAVYVSTEPGGRLPTEGSVWAMACCKANGTVFLARRRFSASRSASS